MSAFREVGNGITANEPTLVFGDSGEAGELMKRFCIHIKKRMLSAKKEIMQALIIYLS
jgi:hypothetical protein